MSDIDSMPAGIEMDRMVADKVMGWRERGWSLTAAIYTDPPALSRPNGTSFQPSTNIAHAWEVVEQMRMCVVPREGGGWYAMAGANFDGCGIYEVQLGHYYQPRAAADPAAMAHTAPLAICRAALKAVGK